MLAHQLAQELKAVADTLATGTPEFAKLNRYVSQSGAVRETPSVSFQVEGERLYGAGRRGIVRVLLIVESNAGDDDAPPPDNHVSRVALVSRLFVTEKAARLVEIAARGKVTIDDWGQIPGRLDSTEDGGDYLRSPIILRAAARLV